MKVLLLSTYDNDGGAARATYRILKAVQKIGINARMLVRTKRSDDYSVFKPLNKLRDQLSGLILFLDHLPLKFYRKRKLHFWNVGWVPNNNLKKAIKQYNPSILQLHWISEGFVPNNLLNDINVPVVWRLSDSWAFTGGCHVPFECRRYTLSCGQCPQLGSSSDNDLSRRTLLSKQKHWSKANITIVAPSKWMAQCAKDSTLFASRQIKVIPPGIDMQIFKPMDKTLVRSMLNISADKKIICFGAISATSDINKGFHLLKEAILALTNPNTEIIVLGASAPENPPDFGKKCTYIGRLHDELSMALYYNAADVFVLPSLMENSPNSVIEAMACGVPAVAFAVGGSLDMITHQENGYLVKPYDVADLAKGIEWVINEINAEKYLSASKSAREMAFKNYNIDTVALSYQSLYHELLNVNNA